MSELKRQMQIYTNGLWKDVHHTTAAEWPPELVRLAEPMRPEMPDPKNTFADHSYPAYSRAQMVQAMLDAVELYRRTQPESTKPAQDLGAAILALPLPEPLGELHYHREAGFMGRLEGYSRSQMRDLLKAAAALASPADALVAGDRVDTELARADKSPVKITNQELAAFHRFCDCCEDSDSGGHDVEKSMMSQLVRIGLVRPAGPGRHETTKFGDWLRDSAAIQAQKDGHG